MSRPKSTTTLTMLTRLSIRRSLLPTTTTHLIPPSPYSTTARPLTTLHLSVHGTGQGVSQSITVGAGPHAQTIKTDTYKSLGGNETAPSPLAYSLASLAGCTQVTGSIVAKELGIKLGRWDVEVEGLLDTDVLLKGVMNGSSGNWERVGVKVRVETDLGVGEQGEREFRRFREEVERRCTLTRLFIGSGVGWRCEWVNLNLNGSGKVF